MPRIKEVYMLVSLPLKSVEMFLGLRLEPFLEIVDFAMPFEKKLKYISLGPVGRHFTTFSLVPFSIGISTNIYLKVSRIPVCIIYRDLTSDLSSNNV